MSPTEIRCSEEWLAVCSLAELVCGVVQNDVAVIGFAFVEFRVLRVLMDEMAEDEMVARRTECLQVRDRS